MQRSEGLVRGVVADVVIPYSGAEETDLDRLASEVRVLDASGVDALCIGSVLGGAIGATASELSSLCGAIRQASQKNQIGGAHV